MAIFLTQRISNTSLLRHAANNVMVMVELSGSNTKEGIASVIAIQYAVAPILLSLFMAVAIWVATNA